MNNAIDARSVDREIWASIPGHMHAYEVSSHGRVRSLDRHVARADGKTALYRGKLLNPFAHNKGYMQVSLSTAGTRDRFFVHRLVLLAFDGPCPKGQETRHLNGNPADNRLVNLRYGTPTENSLDQRSHGTHNMASRTACPHGHDYTPSNTTYSRGARFCRTCAKKHRDARRARLAQMSASQ